MAGYSPKVRKAIESARVMPGMTREQVLVSVGYPVTSENPQLDAKVWRFWLSSFAEFQVIFGADDRVKEITTDAQTRNLVVMD
jgi:outer membrane protein assembly factor BamE (lipoprotein component of BamABCDE complex)